MNNTSSTVGGPARVLVKATRANSVTGPLVRTTPVSSNNVTNTVNIVNRSEHAEQQAKPSQPPEKVISALFPTYSPLAL